MYETDERGEIETEWGEADEQLGVPAHLWDQTISQDFILSSGNKLPDAFPLLMRGWVQNGGGRYDHIRPHKMSDRQYVDFLLVQACSDTNDLNENGSPCMFENAIAHQHQKAIDDFNRDNITGPRN